MLASLYIITIPASALLQVNFKNTNTFPPNTGLIKNITIGQTVSAGLNYQ